MQSTPLIFSLISVAMALLSLSFSIITFITSRRRENYQNFHEQTSLYASLDILMATRRLWRLYREFPGTKFLDKYIEIMEVERQQASELPHAERITFEKHSLHYQRKQLIQFWRGLALLIKNGLIPREAAYEWWQREDVDLVIKVLLPIEDKLADFLQTSRLNPVSDPIYYLVKIRNKFY